MFDATFHGTHFISPLLVDLAADSVEVAHNPLGVALVPQEVQRSTSQQQRLALLREGPDLERLIQVLRSYFTSILILNF